jgi:ubiquinone/menaquinone biosynthesis C-methylase UbiE
LVKGVIPVDMENRKNSAESNGPDTDQYIQRLFVTNPLREPVLRSAIQALQPPVGSRGLDAGCGIGLQTVLLAEAVGPAGHVIGLDLSPEFLLQAEETVKKSALSEQISFREGNVSKLPFDDDTFDWLWSADCVGYPAVESPSMLKELARVVKPGGSVAILGWSSQQLLPGYPLLEARLNAIAPGYAAFFKGMRPERHFLRALGWFHHAGFETPTARTLVGNVHAPLGEGLRDALLALFEMLWAGAESEATPADWVEFQGLCQPESPDFILDRPDYYAFFTYSLFRGRVTK